MVKMNISEQILSEIAQYHKINKYIIEQDVTAADPTTEPATEPAPDAGALPPSDVAGTTPPVDTTIEPQPIDVENDPDVEVVGDENTEGGEEELEITDLISAQKNIESKQEEYFNNLFSQLSNLESKLGEMDQLVNKINSLETKFDQFRPKTPEEKLELRSLDSGPFKQKLSDFFVDKQEEMKQSGKNEYVLTSDDVEEYSPEEVKTSFNDYEDEDENNMMR